MMLNVLRRYIFSATMLVAVIAIVMLTRHSIAGMLTLSATVSSTHQQLDARPNSGYSGRKVAGRIASRTITEASGLVASRVNPGMFWTHNDSGTNEIFCVTGRGSNCGTFTVTGAAEGDWEDLAAGPGPVKGTSYLYVGDIGDNDATRSSVTVYRIPEPTVGNAKGKAQITEPAHSMQFTYPEGAQDAETLMIHPRSGDLYIVTKGSSDRSRVYKADAPLSAAQTMQFVSSVRIKGNFTGRTGGAISPDGRRVVLSTYADAVEFRLGTGSFDAIWNQRPHHIRLGGGAPQREAVAYALDGNAIYSTSEGVHPALVKVERLD